MTISLFPICWGSQSRGGDPMSGNSIYKQDHGRNSESPILFNIMNIADFFCYYFEMLLRVTFNQATFK